MRKVIFLLILSIQPLAASAVYVGQFINNGFAYWLYDSNTAEIVEGRVLGLPSPKGDLVIPESVEYEGKTYRVTTIGGYAFAECPELTSVTIPNSIDTIRYGAFRLNSQLRSIVIPNSVVYIGDNAFYGCQNLESVTLSENLSFLSEGLFYGSGLRRIDIPKKVKEIKQSAFSGSKLLSVNIPDNVVSIGSGAFSSCNELSQVSLGNGVKRIGSWAFSGCSVLSSIVIPNSVLTVGNKIFENCTNLSSVTVGCNVYILGEQPFLYCNSLTEVYCYASNPPKTSWIFDYVDIDKITLYVPNGCKEKYENVDYWNVVTNIVEIDAPVSDMIFSDCQNEEYREAAIYLYALGIVEGEDGKLYADREVTRAEVAKTSFYGAYFGPTNVPEEMAVDYYPSVYADLQNMNTYYYRPAKALLYLEYGDGVAPFDRNRLFFEPEDRIARVNVLKELMETFNIKPILEGTYNPFPNDADVVALAKSNPVKMGYIRRAAELGIITTANDEFRPYADCTRGEEFLMLARIMQKIENHEINNPNPQEADYFQPLNTTLKTISLGAGFQMGNFQHYTKTSFALSGIVPMAFIHTYNSYNTTLPSVFFGDKSKTEESESYQPLGDGWSHNYHSFITVVGEYSSGKPDNGLRAIVHWGGGSIDVYKSDGSRLIPESMGIYNDLELDGQDAVVRSKSQIEYRFSKQGGTGSAVLYLSSIKDRNGNTLTINYENGQNGSKRISSVSDGNRSLKFSYLSGTDFLSEVKDPLNRSIKFEYFDNIQTGRLQLKSFTDAEGNTTTYEYADLLKAGSSKLLSRIQLPKGNYIENEYDANCRLKNTVNGVGGSPTTRTSVKVAADYGSGSISTKSQVDVERGSQTSTYNFTYNQNNVITNIEGAQGLFANMTYGNADHPELPTSMQNNKSNVSNISYDAKGNVTNITVSGDGTLTTSMTYDGMNNLTSVTDPKGNKTTYSYDANGNLTGVSAPEGVTTSMTVDNKGLPTETTNPMGVKIQYQYNDYGNLTKVTLPALGLTSTAVYDAASRMTSATDALGRTHSFVYNDNDYLTSETDAMNHTIKYAYDKNDNLTSITNAKGGVTTMSYDNATDWLLSVEFAGAKKQYDYNQDGTLNSYTKPDGMVLSYTYDELGRVTRYENYEFSYDNKYRLSEISNAGDPMNFSYDGFNRITGVDYDGSYISYSYDDNGNRTSVNDTQYSYDGLNRLTKVSFYGKSITYTYRKDSKLEKISYPNGMTTTFGYDEVGRLISKHTKLSDGTVIAGYDFVLDKAGNITEQTSEEPYSEMILINEDANYSYNDANRITRAGDIDFEFDANGNTTKRGSTNYVWNSYDQLIGEDNFGFIYDPLGHLASYQGDIKFVTDPLGIGNVLSDSKSGAEYIYGNGLEARIIDGYVSYYVTDVRGSVVAIVDENGEITHRYQYNAFGKITRKEEADYNPFQYVGKYGVMALNDNLYYMRARLYDPTIGRFLSEDPIWSTNLYPYADNNPIMGIDPMGLMTRDELEGWFYFHESEIAKRYKRGSRFYNEEMAGIEKLYDEELRKIFEEERIQYVKIKQAEQEEKLYASVRKTTVPAKNTAAKETNTTTTEDIESFSIIKKNSQTASSSSTTGSTGITDTPKPIQSSQSQQKNTLSNDEYMRQGNRCLDMIESFASKSTNLVKFLYGSKMANGK